MTQVEKFAWDTLLEEKVKQLVTDYHVQSVIETGTWMGGTTQALAAIAEMVYTIEINPEFYRQAQQLLAPLPNVKQFLGRSEEEICRILPMAKRPTLYYLDAHWHGNHPLPQELALIAAADPSPIIVMHDFQVPGHPELKFDPLPDGTPYRYDWVLPQLRKIQKPWRHFYNEKATGGCQVGVLFVVPEAV